MLMKAPQSHSGRGHLHSCVFSFKHFRAFLIREVPHYVYYNVDIPPRCHFRSLLPLRQGTLMLKAFVTFYFGCPGEEVIVREKGFLVLENEGCRGGGVGLPRVILRRNRKPPARAFPWGSTACAAERPFPSCLKWSYLIVMFGV